MMIGTGGGGGGAGGGSGGDGGVPLSGRIGSLPGLHQNPEATSTGKGGMMVREERVPQWGQQETRDLIAIRADLERDFNLARRNKTLWEAVAAMMRERGYRRTPEQCKCKWKNLVNRYKGKETADPETGRQCPFFDELHAVFTERARSMQRLLLEAESGAPQSKKKLKRLSSERSSEELSEDDDNDDEDSDEEQASRSKKKKQRPADKPRTITNNSSIHEVLQDFFQHQQRIESQWHEMMERRAQERQRFEQEWKQTMEKLERERLMLERAWREKEEQRRMREESRAEKRDALLTTLLNKLIQEEEL